MKIQEHTPTGIVERDLTVPELRAMAKQGDKAAIKELIELNGGWSTLSPAQKEKVTRLLIGEDVTL